MAKQAATAPLKRLKTAGTPPDTAWGRIKGVVEGKAFTFEPGPPADHLLELPLKLHDIDLTPVATDRWSRRFHRFMVRRKMRTPTPEQRLGWKYLDLISDVHLLLGASPALERCNLGGDIVFPCSKIHHPYHLRPAFDMLPDLPEGMSEERGYLSQVLRAALVHFLKQLRSQRGELMRFNEQAQEYFYVGYKLEKLLPKVTVEEEIFGAIQVIYDKYYHGINYYCYALLSGEALPQQNQLFMYYCNALYFLARIDWSGKLQENPAMKLLPDRNRVLFFALRDISLLRQFKSDPDYARQLKAVLRSFPEPLTRKPPPVPEAGEGKQK